MRWSTLSLGLAFVLAAPACAGITATPPGSSSSSGSSSGATPAPTGSGSDNPPGPDATAACAAPGATSIANFSSNADVLKQLGGVWRRCDSGFATGELGGPAGFEVEPDGHAYALDTDGAGHLVRVTGFRHEGWVAYVDAQQVDFVFADSGFQPMIVSLSADGATMQVQAYEAPTVTYVATHESVVVPATEAAGAREGLAGCNVAETGMATPAPSTEAARSDLIGRWLVCPGGNAFGTSRTDLAGLELDADGTWAFLVTQNAGTVKSTAPGDQGTFDLVDDGAAAPTGRHIQLNLSTGSGTFILAWGVSTQPMKLSVDNEGMTAVLSAE